MKKYGLPLLLAVILLALFLPVRVSAAGEYSIELTSDIRDVMEDLGVEALPVGEEICVEVWLSGQATYNAYDISFSYHSDHLKYLRAELVEKTVQNMTSSQILVDEIEETIRIRGYGEDKETAGEPVARIWFETILETNPGKTADVQVQAVTVDHADNAGIQEAPPADKRVDTAKAPIRNFKVEVSGDRLGDKDYIRVDTTIADGSEDVHFWVDAVDGEFVHYEVQVKIAGDDVTGSVIPPDPSKGIDCYTIPMNVILTKQGKIEIILHTIYKEFEVTIRGKDVSGEKKATYSKDYRFKLDRQKGYLYTVDVTIGGKEYTLYRVEACKRT